jgi:quinol monooxygenase YgiN
MNNHYALINKLISKSGKRSEVIRILLESGKPFDHNAACIFYFVYEDAQDPNVIWVEDLWTSKEAHTIALRNPDLISFITQTIPLLEGLPEQTEIIPSGGKGLAVE